MGDPAARRERQAAESILENERLTGDLDDLAAQSLLDWGLSCVKRIAQSTEGMGDEQAEETMSARADATQRMMRLVQRSVTAWERLDPARRAGLLNQIIEQAAIAYDSPDIGAAVGKVEATSAPPLQEGSSQALFRQLEQQVSLPAQMIVDMRLFIENLGHTAPPTGGRDDEEEREQQESERAERGHDIEPADTGHDEGQPVDERDERRPGKWWQLWR
jgi:hypothetical protein